MKSIFIVFAVLCILTIWRVVLWPRSKKHLVMVMTTRKIFTETDSSSPSYKGESILEAVVAREDNLLQHKSCLRTSPSKGYVCRDCGSNKSYTSRNECPIVKPRGWCKQFVSSPWDDPPRQESYHDPTAKRGHSHLIRHWNLPYAYEQIPCETTDECWNFSKCQDDNNQIAVYAYDVKGNGTTSILVDHAIAVFPDKLRRVMDPNKACLLVVTPQSMDSDNITSLLSHPAYGDGSNHLIWKPHRGFSQHGDHPFPPNGNYGKASLAMATYMHSQIRPGHDVPIGLEMKVNANRTQTKRDVLLSFKGNICNWDQVWWQHRYLAVEYWEQAADIVVDAECKQRKYTLPRDEYAHLMASSVFSFCPGGGSTNSFRFSEALAMGSIPVVTADLVPPFWPDYDWSGCLLRVSEARIIDLPRMVREISPAEIKQRQARCSELSQLSTIEDNGVYSEETAFVTAIHVWIRRIEMRKEERLQRIQTELERKRAIPQAPRVTL